jgi:hypothetical protein
LSDIEISNKTLDIIFEMVKFLIKINVQMTKVFKKEIKIVDVAIYLENGNVDFLG